MKVQFLVATMYRTDLSFLSKMGLSDKNYIVINQTDFGRFPNLEINRDLQIVRSFEELGLSRSRNRAIALSKGDICVIADDDVRYVSNVTELIENAYCKYKDADLIVFDFKSDDEIRGSSFIGNKPRKLNRFELLKVSSVQITFKSNSIKEKFIEFNELFGAGSKFTAGEENLFLQDCSRNGLKAYFVPDIICDVSFEDSTWFDGYNRKYFNSKGAFGQALYGSWSYLYMLQFLVRKYKRYSGEITPFQALRYCLEGRKQFMDEVKKNG